MVEQERTWRIGELARESGLTVRALHHYDQLGLLSATTRTEGGHRCYTRADVRRLHRIVALRSLGISLDDIGRLLDGTDNLAELLRRQLEVVDERIRDAVALRTRLLDTLDSADRNVEPSTEQLLHVIEETVAMIEPITAEQLTEMIDARARHIRELSETEFAGLKQKMSDTWHALSRQQQQQLSEQRHRALAVAMGSEAGDR
jgi:MerR family transcriptional regulator, thiopeptide resistance regulator